MMNLERYTSEDLSHFETLNASGIGGMSRKVIEQSPVGHYPREAIQLSRVLKFHEFHNRCGEGKSQADRQLRDQETAARQRQDWNRLQCQARIHETRRTGDLDNCNILTLTIY